MEEAKQHHRPLAGSTLLVPCAHGNMFRTCTTSAGHLLGCGLGEGRGQVALANCLRSA